MMLTQLADVARGAGLKVIEVPGWKTRGHGPMSGVKTITHHHTGNGGAKGSAPSLNVVVNGRGGANPLPGPLAQYLLGRDGTVYVVAAGLCYHAGVSLQTSYTNAWAVGIEAEADGVPGFPGDWPEVQMAAYARLSRALIEEFGLKVTDVRGHRETCAPPGRKSDPDFAMASMRARVAATVLHPPAPKPAPPVPKPPTPLPEDVMPAWGDRYPLTNDDAQTYNLSGPRVPATATTAAIPWVKGDLVSYSAYVRYGTQERKTDAYVRSELPVIQAEVVALKADLVALQASVNAVLAALNTPKGI